MKVSIGFSPCPNDTYVFDALVNGHIDTGDIEFEVFIEDVETLNQWALEQRLDITKLSFPALFGSTAHYRLLDAGSALGKGVGPLLVAREPLQPDDASLASALVALPGQHTTAHLLFSMAFPFIQRKSFMLFSDIEEAVLQGRANAGVIIHENRFTYRQKGLHKVMDLGQYWEEKTNLPIPLGGIAVKRSINITRAQQIDKLIATSLRYANERSVISSFVRMHAQSMQEEVMQQHIRLYVNEHSLQLEKDAKEAIVSLQHVYNTLLERPDTPAEELFLNPL